MERKIENLKKEDPEYTGGNDKFFKLEIFIPETHFADLRKALQSADAGHIGNYDCCLSYSKVIGTWRPLPGTEEKGCLTALLFCLRQ